MSVENVRQSCTTTESEPLVTIADPTAMVLKSRRVIPGRLLDAGFPFLFPDWPAAARDLVARWRKSGWTPLG